jgi:hypothetical protein
MKIRLQGMVLVLGGQQVTGVEEFNPNRVATRF